MAPFSQKDLVDAHSLLNAGRVRQLVFSEGTYQVEVFELKQNTSYWPFFQLDDQGNLLDYFCSCAAAEKSNSCKHLAAGYLKIFNGFSLPLHVRFRDSVWNHLCLVAARRHGFSASILKKTAYGYEAKSATGKLLFAIKGLGPQGKKKLHQLLFERSEETEETSLKFSNLSLEEILLWREGKPSYQLQYELSFWADLAKWMMLLQEAKEEIKVTFDTEERLPEWMQVHFSSLLFRFYIAKVNWPNLISALGVSFAHFPETISSSLVVHEFQDKQIKAIVYSIKERCLRIEKVEEVSPEAELESASISAVDVGDFVFIPQKGFFSKKMDPLFRQEVIEASKIGMVLQHHTPFLQKYLIGTVIHTTPVNISYEIHFDAHFNLHIVGYLFAKGDLHLPDAAYFASFAYLPEKGFFPVANALFEGVEKVIAKDRMSDFINRHRVWLSSFEGFQTHVYAVESHLHFRVSDQDALCFETSIETTGGFEEVVDFGEWIYLKNKGFFAKRLSKTSSILPGLVIPKQEIAAFIRAHREELQGMKHFFATKSPLEKSGIEIFLNQEGQIQVSPRFQLKPSYTQVHILKEYTYVQGEGFFEIPYDKRIPEGYEEEKTIQAVDEPYFVFYELDSLQPYLLSLQKELQKPTEIYLSIGRLQKKGRTKGTQWLIEAFFETELGRVDLFEVWRALQENKRYLFSDAGLLLLKHPRFFFLKNIPKTRWLKKGKQLQLNTMQWIRLFASENLKFSTEDPETLSLMDKMTSLQQVEQAINLHGFKSHLRSYQMLGVQWLWFLYVHGLSGLLCDEMGLGKTHQAMGLIAAISNQDKIGGKILVVCPTSVIYHWETLLKKFLPNVRPFLFYGASRTLQDFAQDADLLLTSYGTLRSEKEALSQISFELAVYDELQIAKNPYSRTHKALKKIKAAMCLGLTGTPIENRLLELKALFDIVVPGYMPTDSFFKEFFVGPIEKNQDSEKKRLLAQLIKPFILRRKKAEVLLELPEKIEEISYCDLSEEQQALYKKTFLLHKQGLMQELEDRSKPVPYIHVFSLLSTLKQICDHPCLILKNPHEFQKHSSGKWDLFVELAQETRDSGRKLVVFSQYLNMLDIIEAYLKEQKIGYASIRGTTRDRKEPLERFAQDPKCEVFVASLQAVGVGVDLVSASVVIHYDRWWNPAKENQATDRVHRIGQSRGVQVFKLVTKNTIEEYIHRLIEKKKALATGIIGFDDHDQIKTLSREELLQLLSMIDKNL